TRGYVEALLEALLIAERKWTALCSVDERQEHDVALVALKVRGVPADDAAALELPGQQVPSKQALDLVCLLLADERDDAERRAGVGLVFERGDEERRHRLRFGTIHLVDRSTVLD